MDFNCIERGLALLSSEKQNSQTDLIAGLRLIKRGSQFWITTWQEDLQAGDYPAISMNAEIKIQVPSILKLINEWQVETLEITKPISEILEDEANLDPFQAWLDSNQLVSPLYMRVRRPGDQIKILGLHGHSVKVSDLMINLKLPKQARATWPLICSGSEIVWIPGCRISEDVKVNEDTSRVIHLRLFRNQAA